MTKSETDIHWNNRAIAEKNPEKVNIGDTVQREVEFSFIRKHLDTTARVLEVGCGNGFLTSRLRNLVGFVDAFDYAENMVLQARRLVGEENNRFFHDNVLEPKNLQGPYDIILCVRVLINLKNLAEQRRALANMARALRPGGKLILLEGFNNGFSALTDLRGRLGLPPLTPAPINFYSSYDEFLPSVRELFDIDEEFHTGMFDFLTRVVYPLLVGPDAVAEAGDFHHRIASLAQTFNPDSLRPMARLIGLALIHRT
jgi:SAM-dependent methyltransferase